MAGVCPKTNETLEHCDLNLSFPVVPRCHGGLVRSTGGLTSLNRKRVDTKATW